MGYYRDKGSVQIQGIMEITPDIEEFKKALKYFIFQKGKLSDIEFEKLKKQVTSSYRITFSFIEDIKEKSVTGSLSTVNKYAIYVHELDKTLIKTCIKQYVEKMDNYEVQREPFLRMEFDPWDDSIVVK